LTNEELLAREHIRHTLASYNKSGDADDADGFAACFTEDGILASTAYSFEGRNAIRAWKQGNKALFGGGANGPQAAFRVHHITSVQIQLLDPNRARTRTPWLVITDRGLDHSGIYYDKFRRAGDRWLIEKRIIDLLWRAENSCIPSNLVGVCSTPADLSDD